LSWRLALGHGLFFLIKKIINPRAGSIYRERSKSLEFNIVVRYKAVGHGVAARLNILEFDVAVRLKL